MFRRNNEQILTSAGASAGLDLYLVRPDHGAAVAADAARLAVMPLEREGGQAQFIVHKPPASSSTLQPLLQWIEQRLARPVKLEDAAQRALTSTRTLTDKRIRITDNG
ncbi:MAG TPA: hypothetical protein DCP03_06755 [Polaromonas sp.]|nr:hypothetical protein [Polaromonas sp.]